MLSCSQLTMDLEPPVPALPPIPGVPPVAGSDDVPPVAGEPPVAFEPPVVVSPPVVDNVPTGVFPPVALMMFDVPPVDWSPPVDVVVVWLHVFPPVAWEVVVELPPVPGNTLDAPPVALVWTSPPVVLIASVDCPPPVLGSSAPAVNSPPLSQATALSVNTRA